MANLLSLLALSKPAGATPSKRLETWPIPLSLTISTCQFMWVCIMSSHLQVDPNPLSQSKVFLFHYNIAHHSQFQMLCDICHSVFVVKSLRIIKLWMKFIVLFFWSKLLKKLQLWVTKHCDLNFHIVSSRKSSLCVIRNHPQSHPVGVLSLHKEAKRADRKMMMSDSLRKNILKIWRVTCPCNWS